MGLLNLNLPKFQSAPKAQAAPSFAGAMSPLGQKQNPMQITGNLLQPKAGGYPGAAGNRINFCG